MAKNELQIGTIRDGKMYRFDKVEVVIHWVHTVAFFALLITGLAIFTPGNAWLRTIMGGANATRILHRVFAVPYALVSLPFLIMFSPRGFKEWIKEIFTWDMDDLKLMWAFVTADIWGRHSNAPPAPKFNAGEKVNSLLTLFTGIGLTVSGVIMWWPNSFPNWLVRLSYPIHDLAFLGMCSMLAIHVFLSLAHPSMKAALKGITTGWADEEFCKEHYEKWYHKVAKRG